MISNDLLVVIGLWNTKSHSVTITSVDRVQQAWVGDLSPDLIAVGLSTTGQELSSTSVVVQPPSREDSHDSLVTAIVPFNPALSRIEFRHKHAVIGAYDHKAAHQAVAGVLVSKHIATHSLEWSGVHHAPPLRYHVQVSENGGFTWYTVAVNQTHKSIDLTALQQQVKGVPFKVRVITTDGFHVKTDEFDVN